MEQRWRGLWGVAKTPNHSGVWPRISLTAVCCYCSSNQSQFSLPEQLLAAALMKRLLGFTPPPVTMETRER